MVKKQITKHFSDFVMGPFKTFPIAYVTLCLAFFLPEFFGVELKEFGRIVREGLLCNLQLCNLTVYLLLLVCYGLHCYKKSVGKFACVIVLCLVIGLVLSDYFLFCFFGTHINAYILQLIDETNSTESAEFIQTYLLDYKFLKVLLLLPILAIPVFAIHTLKRCRLDSRYHIAPFGKILFVVYLLWSAGQLVNRSEAFTMNVISNNDYAVRKSKIGRSFVYITYNTFLQFIQDKSEFDKSSSAQDNIVATYMGGAPEYVVVVIGESHNKYHSSLYGYRHKTNPMLEKIENLCVFDDVITSVNATSQSFKSFLSLASRDDDEKWCDVPLLPAIFKKVGYNVVFYSNQFVHDPTNDLYDAACGFVNHPSMRDKLFTKKNRFKYQYDGELIDAYKNAKDSLEVKHAANLILIHLSGQHVLAQERYPSDRAKFKGADYSYRKDLTASQKKYVAEYDNATLYNDSVLYEIIHMYEHEDALVLYFSDHGDEVYDFRDHVGRSYNFDTGGLQAIHHQLDIPFLVYMSDSCRTVHPILCEKIAKSIHRPFMTDDLPHMLLEIGNVSTPLYQSTRSLINENYNVNRKRKPRAITPTVEVDYDSLCSKGDALWNIQF